MNDAITKNESNENGAGGDETPGPRTRRRDLIIGWLIYLAILCGMGWFIGLYPFARSLVTEMARGDLMMVFIVCQIALIVLGVGYVVVPSAARWLRSLRS